MCVCLSAVATSLGCALALTTTSVCPCLALLRACSRWTTALQTTNLSFGWYVYVLHTNCHVHANGAPEYSLYAHMQPGRRVAGARVARRGAAVHVLHTH